MFHLEVARRCLTTTVDEKEAHVNPRGVVGISIFFEIFRNQELH